MLERLTGFFKRESKDIGEMAEAARDKLDEELSRREAELAKSPMDKIRDIQAQGEAQDQQFDHLFNEARSGTPSGPAVTEIVLADGTRRSGNDPEVADGVDNRAGVVDETGAGPEQGGLDWIAPREGEEAVARAFGRARGEEPGAEVAPSDGVEAPPGPDVPEGDVAAPVTEVVEQVEIEPAVVDPAAEQEEAAVVEQEEAAVAAPATDFVAPDTDPGADVEGDPQAGISAAVEAAPVAENTPMTPVEALLGDRADGSPSLAAEPAGESGPIAHGQPEPEPTVEVPDGPLDVETQPVEPAPAATEPEFEKTPAQLRYEQAREAADALLDELRGELKRDGDI